MCGIAGYYAFNKNETDLMLFQEILRQSQIRGRHASGVSFIEDGKVKTVMGAAPIKELVENVDLTGKEIIIAHARYSTSDLKYNQPIANFDLSIVHNGVITQEAPEFWESDFEYKCQTRNDSELVFRARQDEKEPMEMFPQASMAVIEMTKEGGFCFYRNGNRPLWFFYDEFSLFVASTEDILKRAFKKLLDWDIEPTECIAGAKYYIDKGNNLTADVVGIIPEDRQFYKFQCVKNYKKIEV